MSEYTFILNPVAGRGKGRRIRPRLERLLRPHALSYSIVETTKSWEACDLAHGAPGPVVAAIGGDGTINEVANGLVGSDKILGVVPAGSGNDFIKSVALSPRLPTAVHALLDGKKKKIDVGTVTCHDRDSTGTGAAASATRYFVNGVGIGFDAAVAKKTGDIKFLKGTPLYILAVLQTLRSFKAPLFDIAIDGQEFSSRHLLIAIGNGRCAGGGFYLTPEARVDDGLLDLCFVDDVSIPQILRLMPKVMRGKHLYLPQVKFLRGRAISISSKERFFVHADGEIVGRGVTDVRINLCEHALTVIAGENSPTISSKQA